MHSTGQAFPQPMLRPNVSPLTEPASAQSWRTGALTAERIATGSILAICALGLVAVSGARTSSSTDGAEAVPIIALIGIAVAVSRWHPDHSETPVRGIARSLATATALAAASLVAILLIGPADSGLFTGMAITCALGAGYLLAWGYRSVALLRTVVLLSLLTWGPIANSTHTIVRSSIEQPSDLIYQRLAQFQQFGVHAEPWRLFTASLHRGSLVVIAAVVFAIAASRWRVSARVFVDLGVTAAVALVLHHIVVLLSPVDVYDPSRADQVATQPTMEILIAAIAVGMLALVRWRRERHVAGASANGTAATTNIADRDPVIFASIGGRPTRSTTGLIASGLLPLAVLVTTS